MSDLTRAQDAMSKEHHQGKCGACGQSLAPDESRPTPTGGRTPGEVVEHLRRNAEGVRRADYHAGWGLLDEAADTIERAERRLEGVARRAVSDLVDALKAIRNAQASRSELDLGWLDRQIANVAADLSDCEQ